MISLLPAEYLEYVVNIENVKGDGHYGFRTVTSLLGFHKDAWAFVRQDLMNKLSNNIQLYEEAFKILSHVV